MTITNTQAKGFTLACISAVFLSMTGICIRYLTAVQDMDPMILAFWRNIILTMVLFLILECFFPRLVEIRSGDLRKMAAFGLLLALFNYLWTKSVAVNGASVATFLVYSSVPFTAVLGRIMLKETLNPGKVTAISAALAGCLLVSGAFDQITRTNPQDLAIGIGSGLCFALYSILGRHARSNGMNAWTIILYSFGFAAFFLISAKFIGTLLIPDSGSFGESLFSLGSSVPGWAVMIFLAIGPTLAGFGLYNVSLGYLPSHSVNLIATSEPPLTAVFAFFIFGEILSPMQLLGSAMILGAILLIRASGKVLPIKQTPPGHLQKAAPGSQ